MRILRNFLFPIVFLMLVLPVIVLPPPLSGSPDEIIPTHHLLMFGAYPDDLRNSSEDSEPVMAMSDQVPVSTPAPAPNVSIPVPAGMIAAASPPVVQPANTQPDPASFGKGWVQVNLLTSIDSPTQEIEDRQRYMASGLFNVHVYHQYAG